MLERSVGLYGSNLITRDTKTPFEIYDCLWHSAYGYPVILLNYGPLVETGQILKYDET